VKGADGFDREVILKRDSPLPILTWNLAPFPVGLLED